MDSPHHKHEASAMLTERGDVEYNSHATAQPRKHRNYKPFAIKLPVLLLFVVILGVCVALIENLIRQTNITASSESPDTRVRKDLVIENRQTSLTVGSESPEVKARKDLLKLKFKRDAVCSQFPAARSAESSIATVLADVCETFMSSYTTFQSMNAAQLSNFDKWYSTWAPLKAQREQIYKSVVAASADCDDKNITTMPGFRDYTRTVYLGCVSQIQPGMCPTAGQFTVQESSIRLTNTDPATCYAPDTAMAVILPPPTKKSTTTSNPTTITTTTGPPPSLTITVGPAPESQSTIAPITPQSTGTRPGDIINSVKSDIVDIVATSKSVSKYTVTTQYTSYIQTTDQNGRLTSVPAVIVQATVVSTTPTTTGGGTPTATLSPSEKIVHGTFKPVTYFAAIYLAPVLAVLIKMLWEVVYAAFKVMEPFQRLTHYGGASAKRSLFEQYLSNSLAWDTVKACFNGHVLPTLTTLIFAVVSLLATLATSSMSVRTTDDCEIAPGQTRRCGLVWVVNMSLLRVTEGLLVLCIILTILVMVYTWSWKTGISSNPSSIASIASLVNQEALVHDFRSADPDSTDAELITLLTTHRCTLEYHPNGAGGHRYGIGRVSGSPMPVMTDYLPTTTNTTQGWFNGYTSVANPSEPPQNPTRSSSFLSPKTQAILLDTTQLIFTIGLLGLVTAYFLDKNPDAFNNFFNTGSWYSRLIFMGIGSILDTLWKRLEREVRITEPYRRMAHGNQHAETTVLIKLNGTCWSSFFTSFGKLFRHGNMWFQTLVSFVAVLSDFNLLALAGVLWADGQTTEGFRISTFIVMAVTGLMVVVDFVTVLWWRRSVVGRMPRCPDTVGNVFSYLCASRFAVEMGRASLEHATEKERDDMVLSTGWRFSFEYRVGLDGRERWVVDHVAPAVMRQ